jgi:LemA protein
MFKVRIVQFLIVALAVTQLTGCGIQAIPKSENEVNAASAEVTNQYKRRADLIPNLVNTVKGYASHEKETLEGVTEARARATSITIDPSKATPQQVAAFQKAQGELSQALGRLMVVTEKYPELKADTNFRELQAQIEGTENRITVARNRLIVSIRDFDNLVTVFPTSVTNSIFFRKTSKAQWDVSEQEKQTNEKPPGVKF